MPTTLEQRHRAPEPPRDHGQQRTGEARARDDDIEGLVHATQGVWRGERRLSRRVSINPADGLVESNNRRSMKDKHRVITVQAAGRT